VLSRLQQKFEAEGLTVLSISADNEPAPSVKRFAERLGLEQPVLMMGMDVASQYNLKRWPSNVYIDRKGRIVDHDFDYVNEAKLEQRIRELLQ